MNINIDLIESQIIEKKTNKSLENNNENTFICLYDFFCINNIKISEKIKEKYSLLNKYQIINTYSSISIGEVFQQIYQFNMNNITNNKKYVLLEYNKLHFTEFNT
jgi:hypothetical protein